MPKLSKGKFNRINRSLLLEATNYATLSDSPYPAEFLPVVLAYRSELYGLTAEPDASLWDVPSPPEGLELSASYVIGMSVLKTSAG